MKIHTNFQFELTASCLVTFSATSDTTLQIHDLFEVNFSSCRLFRKSPILNQQICKTILVNASICTVPENVLPVIELFMLKITLLFN
ncbi:hypothetical protein RN001_012029 [Aquatica leii]|uniref:Uncharacterized protein n=1 Tax=Aquatica leii TaxID=1421715 RepID=A0AAN7P3A0_9COLE|nr:hypothetical protein RN001_012029 [Aquatica leii]